ncbi:MAG: efflux RND transporter periplasmic adaptor subunit [Phycisphaerae bacterium]|nr:efflux RND transporter periplasmic adaptor subunit [Phycisphaerae bacterium]
MYESGFFKKTLLTVLLAASILLVGCEAKEDEQDAANRQAAESAVKVKRQNMVISLTAAGEIKATKFTEYRCELEGRAVIVKIVPEGTVITQEDVDNKRTLIEFDSADIEERLSQQEISYSSAQADFTRAQQNFEIQKTQNQSDINAGALKVKFALMDLQKYLDNELATELVDKFEGNEINIDPEALFKDPRLKGSALQQKEQLESKVIVADEQLKRANNTLKGTRRLFEKDYVAQTTLDADKLSVTQREIDLKQAETTLKLFIQFDFPKEVEKLCSDYHEAHLELLRIEAKAKSKMAQEEANLISAEQKLKLQKKDLDRYNEMLVACNMYADQPGMVIYNTESRRGRDEPMEIGTEVYRNQHLLTIPDTSQMEARIQIPESWISRVRTGLPAIITVNALEGASFRGEISNVALTPDSQSFWSGGNPDQKLYPAKIAVVGQSEGLRSGMSAKVEVIVEDLENALTVPVQAIVHNGNERYCYAVDAKGDVELREVTVGSYNDEFIEIKEGLTENDKISLVPPKRKLAPPKEIDRPKVKPVEES